MKYQLNAIRNRKSVELLLEGLIPAKTSHLIGYGQGVTFSSPPASWNSNSTLFSPNYIVFSQPAIA
jgi:hypothetical protein